MNSNSFEINSPRGTIRIGKDAPVFIIAEMSGNHNQDIKKAYKIIDEAAKTGADAIKLQTYTADTLTVDSANEYFQVKVNEDWKGQTLYSLYKQAYTPWEWQPKLKEYAESKGLIWFSTPYDDTAVDFLEEMGVELYKIASFELCHIPLLKKIASTKKPVLISRGLSSPEEIELAVKTLKDNGCPNIVVLQCISAYPAKPEDSNLRNIPDIEKRFGVLSGLSDHSLSTTIPIGAVALGACVIEKHFTIDRKEGGCDASFSLEPKEFTDMTHEIRILEKALGKPSYEVSKRETENMVFKRSIFSIQDIKKGDLFSEKNIKIIRPGYGLAPKHFESMIMKKSTRDIMKHTPIKEGDFK